MEKHDVGEELMLIQQTCTSYLSFLYLDKLEPSSKTSIWARDMDLES